MTLLTEEKASPVHSHLWLRTHAILIIEVPAVRARHGELRNDQLLSRLGN